MTWAIIYKKFNLFKSSMATFMSYDLSVSSELYAIAYISTAKTAISQTELNEILHNSRQLNQAKKITGVLFYNEGVFFQYIEGPVQTIQALIKRIERSTKHTNLIVLKEQAIETRLFDDWSMAYNQNPIALISQNQRGLEYLANPFVRLMQDFWSRNNGRFDLTLSEHN